VQTKHLAITIAGAVSLGSYEAGATYEIVDAIRQHNEHPETKAKGDYIRIDVLTGASAGGMTAAILAQKLLFQKDLFVGPDGQSSPYDNPLYKCSVETISLAGLVNTVDKPVPDGDPAVLSILSSNLIERMAQNTLAQPDQQGLIHEFGGMHNAIDPRRGIRLGLALTNINGLNYGYTMFDGTDFLYTDFSDQMVRKLSTTDRSLGTWREISNASVACGAYPFAFRTKDLSRTRKEFDETLEPWPGDPDSHTFTYTDGGVLQNQPLGMAKNLVDENDNHLGNDRRFYLFVSPSSMKGTQNLDLNQENATLIAIGKRLLETYIGQAVFRDWVQAEEINAQIDLLDSRAKELTTVIKSGTVNAAASACTSQQILTLMYACDGRREKETQEQALARLKIQYAEEVMDLGGDEAVEAFLLGILTLEKAGNLGQRDRMRIYGMVTDDAQLAGAGLSAFVGFFDRLYRDHDYDCGRTVAQELLANALFSGPGQLGPIRYTPAPIRPIDQSLNGVHLKNIPKSDVKTLRTGLTGRAKQIIDDKFSNPLLSIPVKLGASLVLGALIDWEFSRDSQGISASRVEINGST
jgi:predicted acylesterase/phospholipase RssA